MSGWYWALSSLLIFALGVFLGWELRDGKQGQLDGQCRYLWQRNDIRSTEYYECEEAAYHDGHHTWQPFRAGKRVGPFINVHTEMNITP